MREDEDGLGEIRDELEGMRRALDEIKQATSAGEYKFDSHILNCVDWIDRNLRPQDRARMLVLIEEWDEETLIHFLGEEELEFMEDECPLALEFIMNQTEGLCLFEPQRIPENIQWEGEDVPELMAVRTAHWLNKRIILSLWEELDELVTA